MLTSSEPIQLAEALEKFGLIEHLRQACAIRPSLSDTRDTRILSLLVPSRPINPPPSSPSLSKADQPRCRFRKKASARGLEMTKCIKHGIEGSRHHGAIELARPGLPAQHYGDV